MNDVCVEGVRWQEIPTSYLTRSAFLSLKHTNQIHAAEPASEGTVAQLLSYIFYTTRRFITTSVSEPEEFSPHISTPVKLTTCRA